MGSDCRCLLHSGGVTSIDVTPGDGYVRSASGPLSGVHCDSILPHGNPVRALSATRPGYRQGQSPTNKGRKYPAEILTPDEVLGLLRAASNRTPTGIRNRALIAILYHGGLRLGEALALRPKDIDLDRGTVTVLHGKGDRRRTVGLDPGADHPTAVGAHQSRHHQSLPGSHRSQGGRGDHAAPDLGGAIP